MMIEIPMPQSPSIPDCHTILRGLFCVAFPNSQEIPLEPALRAEITMRSTGSVLLRQVLRHLTMLAEGESHAWCRVLQINLETWNGYDAHVADGVYTIRQPDLWSLWSLGIIGGHAHALGTIPSLDKPGVPGTAPL